MGSTCKEIKYIAQGTGTCFVEFCVGTSLAGNRGKFFCLNIKYFRERPACSSHLAYLVGVVFTFWAGVI